MISKPKRKNPKTKLSVSDRMEKFDENYDKLLKTSKAKYSKWGEELKNSSKPSVIENRLNLHLGKIVRVKFEFPKDRIQTSFEGELREFPKYSTSNKERKFEVISSDLNSIEFYQKNIKRIYEIGEIWVELKL